MSDFPTLEDLGPLSEVEWGTLRSLSRANADARSEYRSACALADRHMTKDELLEDYVPQEQWDDHQRVVREMCRAAFDYEQRIGEVAWRYASAYALLGIVVLDRVVAGRPPLSPDLVEQLAVQEPTVGELRVVFSLPADHLAAARDGNGQRFREKEQQSVLRLLESASYNLAHTDVDGRRRSAEEIEASRLVPASEPGSDPLWLDLLTPMFHSGDSTAMDIAWHIKQTQPAARVGETPRTGGL